MIPQPDAAVGTLKEGSGHFLHRVSRSVNLNTQRIIGLTHELKSMCDELDGGVGESGQENLAAVQNGLISQVTNETALQEDALRELEQVMVRLRENLYE